MTSSPKPTTTSNGTAPACWQSSRSPLPLALGKTNELRPRSLALSAPAGRLWFKFADRVETAIRENGEYATIRGLANKLPEHAARLAGVLTLVRAIEAGEIGVDEMAAGIVLAQHYAAEALRLFGASQIGADLHLAKKALDWLLHQWSEPAISLPDLYQRGPNAIREASTARKIVTKLEEHGWLIKIPQGAEIASVRRRDAWLIVRG